MTSKKKLKRAIRAHALETDTSYSTARRAFGITPPAPPAPPPPAPPPAEHAEVEPDEPPVEVIRRGLMHDVPGEFITLRLPDRRFGSIASPAFTVAYAIVGDDGNGVVPLKIDVPAPIVFCRMTPDDQWTTEAFQRGTERYPALRWRPTSAMQNGSMIGGPTRYWVQWLTLDQDGRITWERGRRGLRSLDDVLNGTLGPKDDPADGGAP